MSLSARTPTTCSKKYPALDIVIRSLKEPLYRNSLSIVLSSAAGAFFGLLFWALATRLLSAESVGLASAAMAAAMLIYVISRLGLDWGVVRYFPDAVNKSGLLSMLFMVTLAVAVLLSIIFLAGLTLWSPGLVALRNSLPFTLLFIGYVALYSISASQYTAFLAKRKAGFNLILNLILGIRIPLLLLILSTGAAGIFLALDLAYAIPVLLGFFFIARLGLSLKPGIDWKSLKEISAFSLGNYTASIVTYAPSTIMPLMIINTLGPRENAYFYIAYSLASLLFMIPDAISLSLFVEGANRLPLRENTRRSLKMTAMLLLPPLLVLILFGDRILLLFSREYAAESFTMLQLLAVSSIFSAINSLYLSVKKVQKDIRAINYVNGASSALIMVLGYLGLMEFGLKGLGLGWLIANALVASAIVLVVLAGESRQKKEVATGMPEKSPS